MNAGVLEWPGFPGGAPPNTSGLGHPDDGYDVWGDGTYVYVANGSDGIRAYTFDGTAFTAVGNVDNGGNYKGVFCFNDIVFAGSSVSLFTYTFDGTDFTNQNAVTYAAYYGDTAVYGVYADSVGVFAARETAGMSVYTYGGRAYSLSSVGVLAELGTVKTPMWATTVWADNDFIYFGDRKQIRVFSFNGTTFTFKNAIVADANAALWGDGTYLYALGRGGNNAQLQAFSISSVGVLAKLADTSALTGTDSGYDVFGDGTYIYVAMGMMG